MQIINKANHSFSKLSTSNLRSSIYLGLFVFLILNIFLTSSTYAQTATPTPRQVTQYNTNDLRVNAAELCGKYTNYSSVFGSPSSAGGASSVPVDFTKLVPYLISISNNTQLEANEARAVNTLKFCTEYQNMAAASTKLLNDSVKVAKNLADKCYTDLPCYLDRVKSSNLEKLFQDIESNGQNSLSREQKKIVRAILYPEPAPNPFKYDEAKYKFCNDLWERGISKNECDNVPSKRQILASTAFYAKDFQESSINNEVQAFASNGGVRPSEKCLETYSGADPSTVNSYDKDCKKKRQEAGIINQEILKQITALPFTQAFSPSSVLGTDDVIRNINTRVREGNLVDPDISPNFGSASGNGGVGGTGNGGSTDLKAIEGNYKKLLSNVDVILNLYNVGRLAYASSTSVCKGLPVQSRSQAIVKIDAAKKTYENYKTDLVSSWDKANKNINENNSNLIVKVNFDLKDKINQELITKVYDAVKALLQVCVDVSTPTS